MATAAPNQEATVFVVDDDDAVRESLVFLMKSIGLKAESFPSALFISYNAARAGCLCIGYSYAWYEWIGVARQADPDGFYFADYFYHRSW